MSAIFIEDARGIYFRIAFNISILDFSSGTGSEISLSNLPLRLIAVSSVSGREVVAITKTSLGNLSRQLSNSLTIRRSISLEALSRLPAIASISSMTITDGAFSLASLNKFLIFFSDSPLTPPIIAVLYLKKNG
jgi:hypothetical protein